MADQETSSATTTNVTSLTDIGAAFQILRKLNVESLKLKPAIFSEPLYRDTNLHREQEDDEFEGVNQILRKNVYYMATLVHNISNDVIEKLYDSDILNEEECNQILQQPSTKLRSVKMFAFLVEKDDPDSRILPTVVSILKENNNGNLAGLLENFCDDYEDQENAVGADDAAAGIVRNEDKDDDERPDPEVAQGGLVDADDGRWSCRLCTFSNSSESLECEVCTLRLNEPIQVFKLCCPRCTYMNSANTVSCNVCGFCIE